MNIALSLGRFFTTGIARLGHLWQGKKRRTTPNQKIKISTVLGEMDSAIGAYN